MQRFTALNISAAALALGLAVAVPLKSADAAPLPGLAGSGSAQSHGIVEKTGWRRWRYIGPHRYWWRRWHWRRRW